MPYFIDVAVINRETVLEVTVSKEAEAKVFFSVSQELRQTPARFTRRRRQLLDELRIMAERCDNRHIASRCTALVAQHTAPPEPEKLAARNSS